MPRLYQGGGSEKMRIEIKSASPDGMTVQYDTFIMTWDELEKFLRVVSYIEANGYDYLLKKPVDNK